MNFYLKSTLVITYLAKIIIEMEGEKAVKILFGEIIRNRRI